MTGVRAATRPTREAGDQRLRHAERLRTRAATRALLEQLTGSAAPNLVDPDRYHALTAVIEDRPKLAAALRAGNGQLVQREWQEATRARRRDRAFLRARAVLQLECALGAEHAAVEEEAWTAATALWAMLVGGSAFTRTDGGDPAPDRDEAARQALEAILDLHASRAARCLAAGETKRARTHTRCLAMCADGRAALDGALGALRIDVDLRIERARLAEIGKGAARRLDGWCATLVREATAACEEPEAIARLTDGMTKDYDAGLARLRGFVALGFPVERALRGALELFNAWSHELYVVERLREIEELLVEARPIADQLVGLATTGRSERPANQALSTHFLLRGFTVADPDARVAELERALAWNPANSNARELLDQAQAGAMNVRRGRLQELVEARDWDGAQVVVGELQARGADAEEVTQIRATIARLRAEAAAEAEDFVRARDFACESVRIQETPRGRALLTELERIVEEQPNRKRLDDGAEALRAENFSRAIRLAAQVPKSSALSGQARELMLAARLGELQAADERDDRQAQITALEHARLLADGDLLRQIDQRLANERRAGWIGQVNAAIERGDHDAAIAMVRERLRAHGGPADDRSYLQRTLADMLADRAGSMVNERLEMVQRGDCESGQDARSFVRSAAEQARTLLDEALALDKRHAAARANSDNLNKLLKELRR